MKGGGGFLSVGEGVGYGGYIMKSNSLYRWTFEMHKKGLCPSQMLKVTPSHDKCSANM